MHCWPDTVLFFHIQSPSQPEGPFPFGQSEHDCSTRSPQFTCNSGMEKRLHSVKRLKNRNMIKMPNIFFHRNIYRINLTKICCSYLLHNFFPSMEQDKNSCNHIACECKVHYFGKAVNYNLVKYNKECQLCDQLRYVVFCSS